MHKVYKPGECPADYNYEEGCPYCDEAIPVVIDNECFDYRATCPVCGKPLMLCTLCRWDAEDNGEPDRCDWSDATGCYRLKEV